MHFRSLFAHPQLPAASAAGSVQQTHFFAKCLRPVASSSKAASAFSGAALALFPTAALAADDLPDDRIAVGFALLLLVAIGALQLSLGDIVADEAQLPSSINLINKNRNRRSTFIKSDKNRKF